MTHVLLPECSTLTHINCYYSLLYFYCSGAWSDVAICQLFYTNIHYIHRYILFNVIVVRAVDLSCAPV